VYTNYSSLQIVVNDSGVYLPPSPTEEKGAWPKKYLAVSRSSSDAKGSGPGEIEHFSISRESFDSYRRSFVRSIPTNRITQPRPGSIANQVRIIRTYPHGHPS
jgi:hypothetical protein